MVEPPFEAFAAAYQAGRTQVVFARRVSDLETPVSTLLKFGAEQPGAFLLESVQGGETRGRYSILGLRPDLVWRVRDGRAEVSRGRFEDSAFRADKRPPIESLRRLIKGNAAVMPPGLPPPAAGLFGYLSYDMVRHVERLPPQPKDPLDLPEALLIRPTVVAVFDTVAQEITLVTPVRPAAGAGGDPARAYAAAGARLRRALADLDRRPGRTTPAQDAGAGVGVPTSNIAPQTYLDGVRRCKEFARAGDVFQVVPSQRFSQPFSLPPFALYRALRRINPSPFLFYINFSDFAIVGSSPEILVRVRDGVVTIRPIAGTRPRGATPAEDARLERELLDDPKERAEHLMLLDLGRNDVGRVALRARGGLGNAGSAPGGGVRVTESFAVERYSHVMHIVSNVEGRLDPSLDVVDAFFAGFPAGTVTGAPKVRAMEIIAALEPHQRGVYGGGVGYFSAGGDMDTCIALRTAVIKDGMLHVQAGGGVVLDSDPDAEFQETVHKARAMIRAAGEAWRFS